MSKTIDEKVVSMKFDNSHFEKNVQTSMGTLGKLKNSLKLDGASKGLDNISASAKKCDFSPLSSGIEKVKMNFSGLEVMAVTALANITNSAVNAGKNLINAFTFQPILTGFSEFELKMGSIQTIMAGTGETLDTVNDALNELNTYSDKTIYSFADMTQNIGKFTNAGVNLEQSVGAIQGIANAAALAGANSNEASRAMYNFSQALSIGYVGLMDWKSIELANMATKEFRKELINSAVAMGTLTEVEEGLWKTTQGTEVTITNFRNTLNDQWLTSDALVDTLGRYADETTEVGKRATQAATEVKTFSMMMDTLKEAAQSGWAQTWEIIIGNFEEGKALWTDWSEKFGEVLGSSADSRNAALLGGLGSKWDQLIEKINDAGISTDEFTDRLWESTVAQDESLQKLIDGGKSLQDLIKDGNISSKKIISTIKSFAGVAEDASDSTEDITRKMEEFQKVVDQIWNGDFKNGKERITALTDAGYDYATMQKLVNKTVDGQRLTMEDLSEVMDTFSDTQLESIGYTKEEVKALRELADQAEKTGTPLNELIESLSSDQLSGREHLVSALSNAFDGLCKVLGTVKDAWNEVFYPGQTDEEIIQSKADTIYKIAEAMNTFSESLIINDGTADKLRRTFQGLFSILDLLWIATGGIGRLAFKTLWAVLDKLDINILDKAAVISDIIVAFRKWVIETNFVSQGLAKVAEACKNGFTAIYDWVKAFMELPAVQEAISRLSGDMQNVLSGVKDYFSEGLKRISEFVERVKSIDSLSLENIKGILKDFKDTVLKYFFDVSSILDRVKGAFQRFKDGIWDSLGGVGDKFDEFGEKAKQFIEFVREKIPAAIALGMGALLIKSITRIGDIIEMVAKPLAGIAKIFTSIAIVVKQIGGAVAKFIKAKAFQATASGIKDLAVSIFIIAAAIAILTLIDQTKMWAAVGAIAAIAAVLGLLSFAMSKIQVTDTIKLAGLGAMILELGLAMMLMVWVGKILSDMEWEELGKAAAGIGFLAVIIAGLIWATKLAGPEMGKVGGVMLKIGAAMLILVGVLKLTGNMSEEEIDQGLVVILAMEILIAALIGMSRLAGSGKSIDKIGSMIFKIGVALLAMVAVMKIAASMTPEEIFQGIIVVAALEGMVISLIAISKLAGANADKAGRMMSGIGFGLLGMVSAMKIAASLSYDEIVRGLFVVGALELFMVGLIAISKYSGANAAKAGVMLLLVSGALLIMVGIIYLLRGIEQADLTKALLTIGIMEVLFGGLIAVTKLAKECKGTLVTLTIAVAVLGGVIIALAHMDRKDVATAAAALGGVMICFALLIAATKLVDTTNWLKTLGVLGGMALVVGVLALIIGLLANSEGIDSAMDASTALSVLIVSLAASCVILSKSDKDVIKALPAAAAMAGIVGLLALILWALDTLDVEPSLETAASLSILLLALSGACLILSSVGAPGVGGMALKGAAVLDGVILILGGLMVGIGALCTYIPDLETFLDKGIDVLEKIGYGLGAFFGNIVGGFAEGATAGLPGIGENLASFMTNAQPFFDGVKDIDSSTVESVNLLAKAILTITGASILDAIGSFIVGESSMETFGKNITLLATALTSYSKVVSEEGAIDSDAIEASTKAAGFLVDLANTVPDSSLIARIVELKDLGTFGEQISKFGSAIVGYSKIISEEGAINATAIGNSTTAADSLVTLAHTIPDSSLVASIVGMHDLGTFGEQISKFGSAIVGYSKIVSKKGAINAGAIAGSVLAAEKLNALAHVVPDSSLRAKILDENDLGDFGKQIKKFGKAMVDYSDEVVELDLPAVESSVAAASTLATIVRLMPEDQSDKITSFSDGIEAIGKSIGSFSTSVSENYDSEAVASAITSCLSLVGLFQNFTGLDTSGVSSFADGISQLGSISMEGFTETFAASIPESVAAVNNLFNAMTSTVMVRSAALTVAFGQMMTEILSSITTKQSSFQAAGEIIIQALQNGISSKTEDAKLAISTVVFSCATAAGSYYENFVTAGGAMVEGFAAGITENTFMAEAAAVDMAEAALAAAKAILMMNSPSKVFIEVGKSVPEGFAQGIGMLGSSVKGSVVNMAKTAVTATQDALNHVGQVANSGLSLSPTISPVVDMSNASARNLKLTSSIDASLIKPVDSLSQIVAQAQSEINASNQEVVSAINGLRDDLNSIYSGDDQEIAFYVDSKKLASSLAKPMNRQLNILSKRGAY